MDVFDLSAKISLDTSDYDSGLKKSEQSGKSFASKLGSGLKTAGKVGAVAIGAVATAAAVTGKKFATEIKRTAEYGDRVDKMSQKIGISAKSYQQWDYVMQRAGMSIDTMKMGMKTLSTQASQNADEFKKLGISQKDLNSLSKEELFEKTVKSLSNMKDSTERTAIASKLLGRAGADMGPLLNQGSKAIDDQMKIAEKYGMVMSDKAVKASATFEDSVTTMKMTLTGAKNRMMGEFLPAVTQVTDGLGKMFAGDMSGLKDFSAGIEGVVDKAAKALPKIMKVGGSLVKAVANAIMDNLPQLASTATDMIIDFGKYIVKALPNLLKIGAQIIKQLITSIVAAIPDLIQTAADIVNSLAKDITDNAASMAETGAQLLTDFVTGIMENLPKLLEAGLNLIVALVQGILQAIPKIVEKLPEIITSIINGLLGSIPLLIEAGIKLFLSLVENLPKIIEGIVEAIPKIIDGLIDAIVNNTPKIIEAGFKLFVAIIKNAPKIIWTIITLIPKIVIALVKAIIKNVPKIAMAGLKLIGGLFKRIGEFIKDIPKNVKKIWDKIVNWFKTHNLFQVGAELMKSLGRGLVSVGGWIANLVKKFIRNFVVDKIVDAVPAAFKDQVRQVMNSSFDKIGMSTKITASKSYGEESGLNAVRMSVQNARLVDNEDELMGKLDEIIRLIKEKDQTVTLDGREVGRVVRKYA